MGKTDFKSVGIFNFLANNHISRLYRASPFKRMFFIRGFRKQAL